MSDAECNCARCRGEGPPEDEPKKPAGPIVLGSGRLADEVRAKIAADPDRYRPESWGMRAEGTCPCCGEEVFRCTTRHTGWRSGFATYRNVVHPNINADGVPCPTGTLVGCCCKQGAFGPKHDEEAP